MLIWQTQSVFTKYQVSLLFFVLITKSWSIKIQKFLSYSLLDTGCRKYYPGQWTYGWTNDYKQHTWTNFDEAYDACKQINCGSIGQKMDQYYLRSHAVLNDAGPVPNHSHGPGCWLNINDTRSTYCDDSSYDPNDYFDPYDDS